MKKLYNYLFFLVYCILRPSLLKQVSKGIYLPVYLQFEWLKQFDIQTVVDIGASHGDVSKAIINMFPNATVYAFEPIKKEREIILSKITSKNLILSDLALSNKIGNTYFYVNDHSPSSSMLPVAKEGLNELPFLSNTKKIKVKMSTLDTYFKDKKYKKNIFLKIDVQGAEKLVFDGGKKFLKDVSIIHVETAFRPFYKGQCYFSDIYNTLTKLGFVYAGSIRESEFYPLFKMSMQENSIFIRNPLNEK